MSRYILDIGKGKTDSITQRPCVEISIRYVTTDPQGYEIGTAYGSTLRHALRTALLHIAPYEDALKLTSRDV